MHGFHEVHAKAEDFANDAGLAFRLLVYPFVIIDLRINLPIRRIDES